MQSRASPQEDHKLAAQPQGQGHRCLAEKKKEEGRLLAAKPYVVEDEPWAVSVCEKEKLVFIKEKNKHAADLDKDKDGGDLEKPYVVALEPLALVMG